MRAAKSRFSYDTAHIYLQHMTDNANLPVGPLLALVLDRTCEMHYCSRHKATSCLPLPSYDRFYISETGIGDIINAKVLY